MKKYLNLLLILVLTMTSCTNKSDSPTATYEDGLSVNELGDLNRKVLEFDEASAFNKDLVAVKLKGRWGLLNYKTDEFVQPLAYDTITFENGYWVLVNDDGWSTSMNLVSDEKGTVVFDSKNFVTVEPLDKNLFIEVTIADDNVTYKLIDSERKELTSPMYNHSLYINNCMVLITKDDKKSIVQNDNGNLRIKQMGDKYWDIRISKDNGTFFVCNKDEEWGVIDNNANEIIPCQYEGASYYGFSDGLAVVLKDGKNIVINTNGEEVCSSENELGAFYSEGLIDGRDSENNVFFMDKKGNVQFKLGANIASVSEFSDGVAVVGTEDSDEETSDGKCGLINKKGEYVIPLNYYQMRKYENRIILAKSFMGKVGLYDIDGNEVLPFDYDAIGEFTNGIAVVRKDGHSYFINRNGETGIDNISEAIKKGDLAKKEYLQEHETSIRDLYVWALRGSIFRVLNKKNRELLGSESEIRDVQKDEDGTYSAKFEYKTDAGKYFVKLHGLKFDEKGHFAELPTEANMDVDFVHDMIRPNHDNEVYSLPFYLPNAEEQMMYYERKLMQGNRYNPFR